MWLIDIRTEEPRFFSSEVEAQRYAKPWGLAASVIYLPNTGLYQIWIDIKEHSK